MSAAPELRALLLTDVVDSTKLSEAIGDAAMAAVWARHDRIARDLLVEHRGLEIDKTDGMLLMFTAAADAVAYAMAYHEGLKTIEPPIKARAGLHVGPVLLRENAPEDVARGAKPIEVDGLAKPTAARVMALARGAQTLITPEARQALAATALTVHSHGHWMLKGLADPVELFEVADGSAAGTRFTAPPDGDKAYRVVQSGDRWLSLREIPGNLPQQASSFIGRERELGEIKAHLARTRLVTALGMGGLGKTRLTLQVAADQVADYPEGVWFLDLAPIGDPALVVAEAAQVIGVREEPGRPLVQSLSAHLKSQRVLMVFDNCEHLGRAPAELAHALLKAAPRLRILASSREPLHVPGEQTYPVLPLPVPARGDGVEALLGLTSVQLFIERARMHRPAFELTESEAPAVAELVARLDGIPLAIELAAARVRSLSVAEINRRLQDRFKILTGGARVLQERQQTLRALVDWSYDLLRPDEQLVFNRLACFAGGFTLAAAESICGAEPLSDVDVLDLLGSLVDKSLVMLDPAGGADGDGRYRMLETLRDYAAEKLRGSEEADAIPARHCDYFFDFAKRAKKALTGPEQARWGDRVEDDLDNLRGALKLALSGGTDAFIAVKLCIAMATFWIQRGYLSEGRRAIDAALALPAVQASELARSHGLDIAATLATVQSDHARAAAMHEACLALRRRIGSPTEIAGSLSTLALTRLHQGDVDAAEAGETEALALFRSGDEKVGEAVALQHLALMAMYREDGPVARDRARQALAAAQAIGYEEVEAECELMLGQLDFFAGDLASAASRAARALEVARGGGDRRVQADATRWLGKIDLAEGRVGAAALKLGDALRAFRDFEMLDEWLRCLDDIAQLAQRRGQPERAVSLLATGASIRERLDLRRSPAGERHWHKQVAGLRAEIAADRFEAAWAAGQAWNLGAATAEALALAAAQCL